MKKIICVLLNCLILITHSYAYNPDYKPEKHLTCQCTAAGKEKNLASTETCKTFCATHCNGQDTKRKNECK